MRETGYKQSFRRLLPVTSWGLDLNNEPIRLRLGLDLRTPCVRAERPPIQEAPADWCADDRQEEQPGLAYQRLSMKGTREGLPQLKSPARLIRTGVKSPGV